MTHPLTIAIDGTFSSGKGTLSRRLAAHYGLAYLDTGKLYRAVARDVLAAGGSLEDADYAAEIASQLDVSTLGDPYLKSGEIGAAASKISVHTPVRTAFRTFQRDFASKGAVMDGRDIGTVICPDADAKLFVTADADVRAERRYQELLGYGEAVTLAGVLSDLRERDHRDMNRSVSPLKPAVDAHLLDTTDLSIERAVSTAIRMIDAVLDAKAQNR